MSLLRFPAQVELATAFAWRVRQFPVRVGQRPESDGLAAWRVVTPTDNGHLGLGAEDFFAILVEQGGLAANLQVAACAGLLGQVNELLGVLRGVEEGAELLHPLAGHDGVRIALHCLAPFAGRQFQGGSQPFRWAW